MSVHITEYITVVHNTIHHRTVLIIFPLILQTIIIAQIVVCWRGESYKCIDNDSRLN